MKRLALAVILLLASATSALASGKPDDGYYNSHRQRADYVSTRATNYGLEDMYMIDVESVCTVRCPKPMVKVVREQVPVPVPAPPMIRKTRG